DVSLPCAEPQRRADGIEGRISAADYGHVLAAEVDHRFVVAGEFVGMHQVDASQKLVGRVHPVQMLSGNAHELRQAGAGAYEHRIVTLFFEQFVDGDGASDHDIGFEFHAHAAHIVDLLANDFLGQAELRNAIHQHTAD